MVEFGLVTCLSGSRSVRARCILPAAVFCLLLVGAQGASCGEPTIFGIRLGLTAEAVHELFGRNAVSLEEVDDQTLTAPRPLTPVKGVGEVRLSFENKTLHKITILFELPPQEPTANNLIGQFEKEKERLRGLYGEPADEVADMRVSKVEERHDWLTRGRGYYRVHWKVPARMEVTLWLYGGDEGIVFMEMYESVK